MQRNGEWIKKKCETSTGEKRGDKNKYIKQEIQETGNREREISGVCGHHNERGWGEQQGNKRTEKSFDLSAMTNGKPKLALLLLHARHTQTHIHTQARTHPQQHQLLCWQYTFMVWRACTCYSQYVCSTWMWGRLQILVVNICQLFTIV